MCAHGTTIDIKVTIDASLAWEGYDIEKVKPIDACIAGLVDALESKGIRMLASCCGHGTRNGEIRLKDGPDARSTRRGSARQLDADLGSHRLGRALLRRANRGHGFPCPAPSFCRRCSPRGDRST